jgi:hypothetical protein
MFNFIEKHNYYLHRMIYRRDYDMLGDLMRTRTSNKEELMEEMDHHGNTPLMLAVKLNHLSTEYGRLARVFLENGAQPKVRDSDGWTVMDQAINMGDRSLIAAIFDRLIEEKRKKWI